MLRQARTRESRTEQANDGDVHFIAHNSRHATQSHPRSPSPLQNQTIIKCQNEFKSPLMFPTQDKKPSLDCSLYRANSATNTNMLGPQFPHIRCRNTPTRAGMGAAQKGHGKKIHAQGHSKEAQEDWTAPRDSTARSSKARSM